MQACRGLMIVSLLLGLAAMVVSLLGLKCIKIGSAGEQTKAKVAVSGGVLSMLGGEWARSRTPVTPVTPVTAGLCWLLQVRAAWWPSPGTPTAWCRTSTTRSAVA